MITNLKDILAEINGLIGKTVHVGTTEKTVVSQTEVHQVSNAGGVTTPRMTSGDLVPIIGIALMILICLVAFVWGANSAKRRMDYSYRLRNDRNRKYRTFTQTTTSKYGVAVN